MNAQEAASVLKAFDDKADEYKRFGSSHRRIQAVRKAVQEELETLTTEEVSYRDISYRISSAAMMKVQQYDKSGERIAEMIKHADETESW